MRQATNHFLSLTVAAAICFGGAPAAHAIINLPSGWVTAVNQGNGPINDASTNSPIIGDLVDDPNASSNSADGEEFHAPFPSINLATDGDKITFTGTMLLQGSVNSVATSGTPRTQFRFGMFKDNGSADNTGWLGYMMVNTHGTGTPNGSISRKNAGNTSTYLSTTGATALVASGGNGTVFNDDTFTLSLSIERALGGDLSIDGSITGTSTTNFSQVMHGVASAASVVTYEFDRLGFLLGSNLDADRAAFSNLTISATGPDFSPLGDYNNNGIVDAADYAVWRKNSGGIGGSFLVGDSEPDGDVDGDDYTYWRSRFGNSTPGGSGSGSSFNSANVPEPSPLMMAPIAAVLMLIFAHRQTRTALQPVRGMRSR